MDQQTIAYLTFLVRLYRELRRLGLYDMPLEIKGLKGKALLARKNIDALNSAYDGFNEAAPKHVDDVNALAAQVAALSSDLEFAANVLGNSTEHSDESNKKEVGSANASAPFPDSSAG